MKAKIDIHILCPKCNLIMATYEDRKTYVCTHTNCENFSKEFQIPNQEVELIEVINPKVAYKPY